MVVGDLANGIGRFLWSRDYRIARLWRREWPVKLALVRALPFVTSVTHDGYTVVGTASWEGDGIPLFKLKIQNVVNNFEGCQIADMRALNHSTQVRINFGTKTCFEPPFVYEGPAEPRTCWTAKCSVDLMKGRLQFLTGTVPLLRGAV